MQKVNRNRQHNTFRFAEKCHTRTYNTITHIHTKNAIHYLLYTGGGQTSLQATHTHTHTLDACVCGAINILCALSLAHSLAQRIAECVCHPFVIYLMENIALSGGRGRAMCAYFRQLYTNHVHILSDRYTCARERSRSAEHNILHSYTHPHEDDDDDDNNADDDGVHVSAINKYVRHITWENCERSQAFGKCTSDGGESASAPQNAQHAGSHARSHTNSPILSTMRQRNNIHFIIIHMCPAPAGIRKR